jgi:hypothetical protein
MIKTLFFQFIKKRTWPPGITGFGGGKPAQGHARAEEKRKNGCGRPYSMWIASDGQTSTQVWQSTHMSLSTFALSFSMEIADAGHSLTQVSHPVHFSLSTIATNSFTPSSIFAAREKKGLLFCVTMDSPAAGEERPHLPEDRGCS